MPFIPTSNRIEKTISQEEQFIVNVQDFQNVLVKLENNDEDHGATYHVEGFHDFSNKNARPSDVPKDTDEGSEHVTDIVGSTTVAASALDATMFNKADGSSVHYTHIRVTIDTNVKETIDASSVTITFADADPDTITRASGDWTTNFSVGDTIAVSGSGSNDGIYTIASLTATAITLEASDSLTAETNTTDSITFRNALQTVNFYCAGIAV